jgi:uncharacterized protein (DUF1697 family)
MKTYVALLRGINVGGKGLLPMKELVAILESLGCRDVKTYIQSGNAVFQHAASDTSQLATDVTAKIAKSRGFAPHVLVLTSQHLSKAVQANQFPEAAQEHKSLHLFFLNAKPAKVKLKLLEEICSPTERFALIGSVFYLHALDGIGRSKLAASVERKLGVIATSRNWQTVCKLLEISQRIE